MRNRNRANAGIVIIVAMLVLLPVLYVLSTGPSVLLVETGWLSEDSFEVAYYPLILVAQQHQPFGRALERYVRLWETLIE